MEQLLGLRKERHKLDVVEIKCLCSICRVTRIDKVRNSEVRHRLNVRENVRVDHKVLNWLGHVERMTKRL